MHRDRAKLTCGEVAYWCAQSALVDRFLSKLSPVLASLLTRTLPIFRCLSKSFSSSSPPPLISKALPRECQHSRELGSSCLQVQLSKNMQGFYESLPAVRFCQDWITGRHSMDTQSVGNAARVDTRRLPVPSSFPPTGFSLPLGGAGLVVFPVHSLCKVVWWGKKARYGNILICLCLHMAVPGGVGSVLDSPVGFWEARQD